MFLKLGPLPDLEYTFSEGWIFNFSRESLSVPNLRFCGSRCVPDDYQVYPVVCTMLMFSVYFHVFSVSDLRVEFLLKTVGIPGMWKLLYSPW